MNFIFVFFVAFPFSSLTDQTLRKTGNGGGEAKVGTGDLRQFHHEGTALPYARNTRHAIQHHVCSLPFLFSSLASPKLTTRRNGKQIKGSPYWLTQTEDREKRSSRRGCTRARKRYFPAAFSFLRRKRMEEAEGGG